MGLDMYLNRVVRVEEPEVLAKDKTKMTEDEFEQFIIKNKLSYRQEYEDCDVPDLIKDNSIAITVVDETGPFSAYVFDSEGVCYWRKANQIRNWFDQKLGGVENCGVHPVNQKILQDLVDDCNRVLMNKDLAEDVLPSQSGFFFGSTDYDEYYYYDLEETVKNVTEILEKYSEEELSNIYYSEWW